MEANMRVLHNKYTLICPLVENTGEPSQSWIAVDENNVEYVVKMWPFLSESGNDLQRALWDLELRTLYRVNSSPGAEEYLMTIDRKSVV